MKLRGNAAFVGNELTEVNFVKAPKLLLLLISSVALGTFGLLGKVRHILQTSSSTKSCTGKSPNPHPQ